MKYLVTYDRVITEVIEAEDAAEAKRRADGLVTASRGAVTLLAYISGAIWQENSAQLWWSKSSPSATWSPAAGTSTNPVTGVAPPPPPPPPGTKWCIAWPNLVH
jgi:hypothetical protein